MTSVFPSMSRIKQNVQVYYLQAQQVEKLNLQNTEFWLFHLCVCFFPRVSPSVSHLFCVLSLVTYNDPLKTCVYPAVFLCLDRLHGEGWGCQMSGTKTDPQSFWREVCSSSCKQSLFLSILLIQSHGTSLALCAWVSKATWGDPSPDALWHTTRCFLCPCSRS